LLESPERGNGRQLGTALSPPRTPHTLASFSVLPWSCNAGPSSFLCGLSALFFPLFFLDSEFEGPSTDLLSLLHASVLLPRFPCEFQARVFPPKALLLQGSPLFFLDVQISLYLFSCWTFGSNFSPPLSFKLFRFCWLPSQPSLGALLGSSQWPLTKLFLLCPPFPPQAMLCDRVSHLASVRSFLLRLPPFTSGTCSF